MTDLKRQNLTKLGQKVGKEHGREGGIRSRQSPITREMLQTPLLWEHTTGAIVQTCSLETVSDLRYILNQYVPESVPHSSGVSAILRGIEPRRYGWWIKSMAISSEAGGRALVPRNVQRLRIEPQQYDPISARHLIKKIPIFFANKQQGEMMI
jgi:hypothetical protein